jgi:hypothetical protein
VSPPPYVPSEPLDPELSELKSKLDNIDSEVRLKALEDLAKKGARARPLAEKICNTILDSNSSVSLAAIASLEKIRPDLYKPLVELFIDKSSEKHFNALATLGARV